MNPITEDHRQTLAGLCRIEIKRWEAASDSNPNMRYMVDLMETALASLEAQPVAYMTYKGYLLHAADPKVAEHSEPDPLYDAPPVPALKPIDLPCGFKPKISEINGKEVAVMVMDCSAGWLNKTAVIIELRKLGYEVKE